ncbi:MAG: NADH-quinone oxidoreductase subunit L [Sphingobacteriales bacterium]|nr:NADH-quinone oxidoreductase subunit L [Sphingobacteriales bacterium]
MNLSTIALLIPLLPLLGFLMNGIGFRRLPNALAALIACGAALASFVCTLLLWFNDGATAKVFHYFDWLTVGTFHTGFSFLIDPLSLVMLLVVTGVGSLIHLYSVGYMHDDEGFGKFMAFLNLFMFSMLLLVLGSNYLVMFIGWEGVGLCSFLLIGFWNKNAEYNAAARKAFVMNRIGDLGFLLGMFLLAMYFNTLEYQEIFAKAGSVFGVDDAVIVAITLLLFVGAMGKSAQIPLYTWLPDAMAGPTPVSALIHAATMVTAGIYMCVRSNALYNLAPTTLHFIALIGLATSIVAALIGLRQNDIKKVLAYSTVSQLGLMFTAVGVGAYGAAMFHLVTHAFFKALLFLGAGSVIHAMSGEQDIRNMGALRQHLPITFFTFLIATLAIIGFPALSGFFSKDGILASLYAHNLLLWGLTGLSAMLTAIYMLRLLFVTFFGEFRGTAEQKHHLHESPLTMTLPLMILAVLSAVGGYMNMPAFIAEGRNYLDQWLSGVITMPQAHLSHATEWTLTIFTSAMVFVVLAATWLLYVSKGNVPVADSEQRGFTKLLAHKFYVDEIYNALFVYPLMRLSRGWSEFTEKGIDWIVNGSGILVKNISNLTRQFQTGDVGNYILATVLGLICFLAVHFLG